MKLGFYIKWDKFSLTSKGNVVGDELLAESLCKAIKTQFSHIEAQTYAPNYLPNKPVDIMIYLNEPDFTPKKLSKKAIFYYQSGYNSQQWAFPSDYINANFDALFCFSRKMLQTFGKDIKLPTLYLPFGVDTSVFYPRESKQEYQFEVAYIGNDIKGKEATMLYLYPALDFNFGLFGNWHIPRSRFRIWRNFKKLLPYQKPFENISLGKIPQEHVPLLYSNAKINLNCTLQSCIDWDVITLRTMEVLACNGFLISDKVPLAQKILKDCMVFTNGGDELKEQINYYLANEKERVQIANKGYEFVTKYCKIAHRAKDIIEFLEREML